MSSQDLTRTTQNYETDGGNTWEVWGAFRMNGADCKLARGSHAVTSGEGAAHSAALATGLTSVATQFVQILRGGKVATSDAAVSVSGGTITVGDGSTYALTAGDVVNWLAIGA